MPIFLLERPDTPKPPRDVYVRAVVAARTAEDARRIHPFGGAAMFTRDEAAGVWRTGGGDIRQTSAAVAWVDPAAVRVTLVGDDLGQPPGVVLCRHFSPGTLPPWNTTGR